MLKHLLDDAKVFALFLLIASLITFADSTQILNFPKSVSQTFVLNPIQFGFYKTSLLVQKQFEFIILAGFALEQNKALNEQLAQVLSDNANLRKTLSESNVLGIQQKALISKDHTTVPVRPIGVSRYLYIDGGSDQQIKVGQSVVYKDNYLGKIVEVSPKKAKVLLVTDSDSHLSAFIESDKGRAKGVLTGNFGSEMILDKVLHQEPVSIGDLVYSDGSELNIPRGLVLGQVTEVSGKDNDVFKTAKVKPVFDIGNLDLVFVITD